MDTSLSFDEFMERDHSVISESRVLAEQVQDQNLRFDEVSIVFVDEPDILTIAQQGIAEEQQETFANLAEISPELDSLYTTLGRLSCSIHNELTSARQNLTSTEEEVTEKEQAIEARKVEIQQETVEKTRSIIHEVERLSPKAVERVKALLGERVSGTNSMPEISELEDDIIRLMEVAEQTGDTIELLEQRQKIINEIMSADDTWELPRALLELGKTVQVTLDELPVEPKLNAQEHEKYRKLREFHIDQPEASVYSALYLAEHVGKTVTVDDLAHFLYAREVVDSLSEQGLRSRVTSLLGPLCGNNIRSVLEDEGYILQYGWRRILEQKHDGRRVLTGGRRRIYRAIRIEDIDTFDLYGNYEGDNYSDEFEPPTNINEIFSRTKEQQLTLSGTTDGILADEQPEEAVPTPAPIPPVPTANPFQETQHESPSTESVPKQDRTLTTKPTEAPEPTVPVSPERAVKNWEKEFRHEIGEAISQLIDEGLFSAPEGVPVKTARIQSSSSIFATKTAIHRITQAGLSPRFKGMSEDQMRDTMLSPSEMIYMILFNRNRGILGKKQARQRRAISLIDDAVDSYFESQKDQQSQ